MSEDNEKIATLLRGTSPAIWAIVFICVVIETVLTLSDWGVLFSTSLRFRVYEYAGFWSGLLGDWGLVSGYTYSFATSDGSEDRDSNTIFFGVDRAFEWRP